MMDQFSIQQWSNYLEAVFELSLKFEVVVLKVLRQKKNSTIKICFPFKFVVKYISQES